MDNNLDLGYRHDWIQKMADVCEASSTIDSTLFDKYEVKRGPERPRCPNRTYGGFRDPFLYGG